jgi:hypothetical protein
MAYLVTLSLTIMDSHLNIMMVNKIAIPEALLNTKDFSSIRLSPQGVTPPRMTLFLLVICLEACHVAYIELADIRLGSVFTLS